MLIKMLTKMLIDSFVFYHFVYGLPVWGLSLSVNLLHCVTRLHNHGVRMTSGLCKCDHMSHNLTLQICYWMALCYL